MANASALRPASKIVPILKRVQKFPTKDDVRNLTIDRSVKSLIRTNILVDDKFNEDILELLAFEKISRRGNLLSISGSKKLLPFIKRLDGVLYMQKPTSLTLQMDKARSASFVDVVHDSLSESWGKEINGKGVIVAILDSEFDIMHPAFLDENGKTRFIAIWDFYPEDNENFPSFAYNPQRVPYGAALMGEELETFPHIGLGESNHGTHVASIAGGSETGNNLRGMAPGVHLIGVKVYQDRDYIIDKVGNPFFTEYTAYDGELTNAIEWVFKIADSLDMPCVVNMSIGSSVGPHDGTSLFDRFIDSISAPGRVIVGSGGNSGAAKLHLDFDLSNNDTLGTWGDVLTFDKDNDHNKGGFLVVDLWGEVGQEFNVQVIVENKSTLDNIKTDFVSSTISGDFIPDTTIWDGDTAIFYFEVDSSAAINGKPHILMGIVSSNDNVNIGLRIYGSGSVDGWHSNMYRNFNSNDTEGFIDGDYSNTIIEIGGTSNSAISVGAYITRGSGVNWEGDTLDWIFPEHNEEVNGIAFWSSIGPTIDGRIKPDVAAPGKMIAGAHTSEINTGVADNLIVQWPNYPENTNKYAYLRGTSMSAPMVTGIVALLLQINPDLDQEQIKEIFKKSSIADEYTGIVPNNRWGVGKVNALKAIELVNKSVEISDKSVKNKVDASNILSLTRNKLTYDCQILPKGSSLILYDIKGRILWERDVRAGDKVIEAPIAGLSNQALITLIKSPRNIILKRKIVLY